MKADYEVSFRGEVIKRPFAEGSKSEHEAVCLLDARGRSFKLRRLGQDPFFDSELEQLVGKAISGHGEIAGGNTMIISEWSEIRSSARKAKKA